MEDRIPSLLTLIITTSPTPSAPETELLTQVIASYRRHCPSLLTCRVIVVLDTYDHIKPRARLKRGQVTAQGAQVYDVYKENVKELFLAEYCPDRALPIPMTQSSVEAEFGFDGRNNPLGSAVSVAVSRTDDGRVTFVEPADRLGFGLAVRTALRLTETSYVVRASLEPDLCLVSFDDQVFDMAPARPRSRLYPVTCPRYISKGPT